MCRATTRRLAPAILLATTGLAAGDPALAAMGWRVLEGNRCGCCKSAEPVLQIDARDGDDFAALTFLPPDAPERVVYNLGVAVATEDLSLYTVFLDPGFVFENCQESIRFAYREDETRIRNMFQLADVEEVVFTITAARLSSFPEYPASQGYVQVATCWDLLRLRHGPDLVDEPNLYVLRRIDPPDAEPMWVIVYWLDQGPCYP